MAETKTDPTDHEQEQHDQEGKPSTKSADNIEKKAANREDAKKILKEVEKLVEHEPGIISADVIKNLQEIRSKLIFKEVEEPKNLQAKLILKEVEELVEHETSISADVIKNLQEIQSKLIFKDWEKYLQRMQAKLILQEVEELVEHETSTSAEVIKNLQEIQSKLIFKDWEELKYLPRMQAKLILQEVEKLVEHETSTSAEVIKNLQEIQAKLMLEEVEELKNLQKIQAKLILKEVKELVEHETSISADVIKNLQEIQAKLILEEVKEHKNLQKIQAKLILKNVEKLVGHKPSVVSGEDIQKLRKFLSDLQKIISKQKKSIPHQKLRLEGDKLDRILKNFEVSYDNLNYQSRVCLLYLSIFPEDAVIKKRPIIYWWIANGLVKPISTGEKNKTAEEVGEDVFQELLQSYLIMVSDEDEISIVNKFQIHPWIRHMLITIARKANLFDFNREGILGYNNASSGHVFLPKDGDSKKLTDSKKQVERQPSSKEKTTNSSHVGSQEDGVSKKPVEPQQSSVGKTANVGSQEDGDSQKPVEKQWSSGAKTADSRRNYFKTLFNVGDRYLSLHPTWFADKQLVALQLGRWQAPPDHHIEVERDDFLSKGLGTQKLLKYLSLRGILKITELPDSILGLANLEILDLKACYHLATLPEDISALTKLTHLDVSHCYLLGGMPKGLGKLTSLQVLKGFIVAESDKTGTRIGDLKALENLKRFSIYIWNEAHILTGVFEELEQLKSVQGLKISWGVFSDKKREQVMKEDFKLPTSLEKLTLEGLPHEKFPDWLKPSKLKKLKMLYIEGGNLKDLGHGESDHEWKVEILHLWHMIKSPEIDLLKATSKWFPYLRCHPDITYREEGHSQEAK